MSECFRKMFFYLAYVVATVGSIAYCFYLIWLLTYVKDNEYYWFFVFIPVSAFFACLEKWFSVWGWLLRITEYNNALVSGIISAIKEKFDALFRKFHAVDLVHPFILIMLMCSFKMLTRQAYYHLSADNLIGPQWVIMSLKGSIVFFVCIFLAEKECRLKKILEDKDILNRGLLDFVDIFNMVELLSLNKCVGIGSSVTEGSDLEMTIQAFCTLSILIIGCVHDPSHLFQEDYVKVKKTFHAIYIASPIFQNIPFLVIRSIVWSHHGVFSLGFMVKNVLAIVVCFAQIYTNIVGADDEEPNHVNSYQLIDDDNKDGDVDDDDDDDDDDERKGKRGDCEACTTRLGTRETLVTL